MSCAPTCNVPACRPSYRSSCGFGSDLIGGSVASSRIGHVARYGISPFAKVGCVEQLPSTELCTQRSPVYIVHPGTILAKSCQSPEVTGFTACAPGYDSYGSYGGGYSYGGYDGYGNYGGCIPC